MSASADRQRLRPASPLRAASPRRVEDTGLARITEAERRLRASIAARLKLADEEASRVEAPQTAPAPAPQPAPSEISRAVLDVAAQTAGAIAAARRAAAAADAAAYAASGDTPPPNAAATPPATRKLFTPLASATPSRSPMRSLGPDLTRRPPSFDARPASPPTRAWSQSARGQASPTRRAVTTPSATPPSLEWTRTPPPGRREGAAATAPRERMHGDPAAASPQAITPAAEPTEHEHDTTQTLPVAPKGLIARGEVLLRMSVDIGRGRSGEVVARAGDRPAELARAFCAEHGLGLAEEELLTQHLSQNLLDAVLARQPRSVHDDPTAAEGAAWSEEVPPSYPRTREHGGSCRGGDGHGGSRDGYGAHADACDGSVGHSGSFDSYSGRPAMATPHPRYERTAPWYAAPATRPDSAFYSRRDTRELWSDSLRGLSCRRNSRHRDEQRAHDRGQPYVSQRSNRMAERRRPPGQPVHVRLYKDAAVQAERRELRRLLEERAEAEALAFSSVSSRSAWSRNGAGESRPAESAAATTDRLYAEGRQLKERRQLAAEQARRRAEEDPELTFRPQVSEATREIAARVSVARGVGADLWTAQHEEARRRELAHAHLAMLYAQEAQREETFAPRISLATTKLALNARRASSAPRERPPPGGKPSARDYLAPRLDRPIHQALYDDAKYKAQRARDNESRIESEVRLAAASRAAEMVSREDIQRMHSAGQAREVELSALREYLHRPVDPSDGLALFAPRVGRGPVDPHARRATGGDRTEHVGMALYDAAREGRLRGWGADREQVQREAERQADQAAASVAAGKYTSSASALMVAQSRRERLLELFNVLTDEREVAHLDTLLGAMHLLPPEVVAAIEPPLRGCGRMMFSINEFVSVVERSFEVVPPHGPRDYLRIPAKPHFTSADLIAQKTAEALSCTFSPRVEPKSEALARRIRTGAPIHEELMARQAEQDQRRVDLLKSAAAAEDAECTFRPALTDLGHASSSRHNSPPLPRADRSRADRTRDLRTREEIELEKHCTFQPNVRRDVPISPFPNGRSTAGLTPAKGKLSDVSPGPTGAPPAGVPPATSKVSLVFVGPPAGLGQAPTNITISEVSPDHTGEVPANQTPTNSKVSAVPARRSHSFGRRTTHPGSGAGSTAPVRRSASFGRALSSKAARTPLQRSGSFGRPCDSSAAGNSVGPSGNSAGLSQSYPGKPKALPDWPGNTFGRRSTYARPADAGGSEHGSQLDAGQGRAEAQAKGPAECANGPAKEAASEVLASEATRYGCGRGAGSDGFATQAARDVSARAAARHGIARGEAARDLSSKETGLDVLLRGAPSLRDNNWRDASNARQEIAALLSQHQSVPTNPPAAPAPSPPLPSGSSGSPMLPKNGSQRQASGKVKAESRQELDMEATRRGGQASSDGGSLYGGSREPSRRSSQPSSRPTASRAASGILSQLSSQQPSQPPSQPSSWPASRPASRTPSQPSSQQPSRQGSRRPSRRPSNLDPRGLPLEEDSLYEL